MPVKLPERAKLKKTRPRVETNHRFCGRCGRRMSEHNWKEPDLDEGRWGMYECPVHLSFVKSSPERRTGRRKGRPVHERVGVRLDSVETFVP